MTTSGESPKATWPACSRRAAILGAAGGLALAAIAGGVARADFEDGWQLCVRCRVLVRAGDALPCAAGGAHRLSPDANYALSADPSPPANHETGWRGCGACGLLTWRAGGRCPATGAAHVPDGATYHVELNQPPGVGEAGGWRWCTKCRGLVRPKRRRGACPNGGRHKVAAGYAYNLYDFTYDF